MTKLMLSCFDYSTLMAQPWAEVGYLCYCVDLQHPKGETGDGNMIRMGMNMKYWIPPRGFARAVFQSHHQEVQNDAA